MINNYTSNYINASSVTGYGQITESKGAKQENETGIFGINKNANSKTDEVFGKSECMTCKSRKYLDGSDDEGVSFQTPTSIAPELSGAKVMSHEMEHRTREDAKAEREGKEVISSKITLKSAICPECGKSYTSGGTTETVIKSRQEAKQEERDKFSLDFYKNAIGKHLPMLYDVRT